MWLSFILSLNNQVEVLKYMQTKCDYEGRFGPTFLKEFKAYLEGNAELKSETKVRLDDVMLILVVFVLFCVSLV